MMRDTRPRSNPWIQAAMDALRKIHELDESDPGEYGVWPGGTDERDSSLACWAAKYGYDAAHAAAAPAVTMSDTRQARIEEIAPIIKEIYTVADIDGYPVADDWAERCSREVAEEILDAITAADADAAPAVGVTVAWLDERIADAERDLAHDMSPYTHSRYLGMIDAFKEVRSLLTAQSEPVKHVMIPAKKEWKP